MEPGYHRDRVRRFERPHGVLRNGPGGGGEIDRNPLAEWRKAETGQRSRRPLSGHRRTRNALMSFGTSPRTNGPAGHGVRSRGIQEASVRDAMRKGGLMAQ